MKEEYYVTVRNNPLNPATLIENIVFAIDLLLFGTFCILSFLDKEYIPSLFFFALAEEIDEICLGIVIVCHNGREGKEEQSH